MEVFYGSMPVVDIQMADNWGCMQTQSYFFHEVFDNYTLLDTPGSITFTGCD